jgi:phosphoenolpyruvate-protein kinase (PTS system EI component)
MAPSAIPRVKEALRAVRAADAFALARRCLDLATCGEIEAVVKEMLPRDSPDGANLEGSGRSDP